MNIYTLASKTGLRTYQEQAPGIDGVVGNWEDLEKFAALVEAAARADEREACAKLCEPQEEHDDPLTAWKIAKAIRARGTT
jgi:hypothetical protein